MDSKVIWDYSNNSVNKITGQYTTQSDLTKQL